MGSESTKIINSKRLRDGYVMTLSRGISSKILRGPVFYKEHPSDILGWRQTGYSSSDVVIEVKDRKRVIAGFAYDLSGSKNGSVLEAHGTYVARRRRGQGLGKIMWEAAIEEENARRIEVQVISDSGLTLVSSLEEKYPDIMWSITEAGSRKLRKMKKSS
jgi:GNAT superfamily N-acetyltransferase